MYRRGDEGHWRSFPQVLCRCSLPLPNHPLTHRPLAAWRAYRIGRVELQVPFTFDVQKLLLFSQALVGANPWLAYGQFSKVQSGRMGPAPGEI